MKVLELFAGSRSVGKACEESGYEVYSSDINDFQGIDYVTDIRGFDTRLKFLLFLILYGQVHLVLILV